MAKLSSCQQSCATDKGRIAQEAAERSEQIEHSIPSSLLVVHYFFRMIQSNIIFVFLLNYGYFRIRFRTMGLRWD